MQAKQFFVLTTTEVGQRFGSSKMYLSPKLLMLLSALRLLIYYLVCSHYLWGSVLGPCFVMESTKFVQIILLGNNWPHGHMYIVCLYRGNIKQILVWND